MSLHPPKKACKGSATRRARWELNHRDCRDDTKLYGGKLFGAGSPYFYTEKNNPPTLPSELFSTISMFRHGAKEMLDPFYNVDQLRLLGVLASSFSKPNLTRKVLSARFRNSSNEIIEQILFSPRLALYLIFVSEDRFLEFYLKSWRRLQPHISLKIPTNLITAEMKPGCSCSGCFGNCVRIAARYKILPDTTSHELLEKERFFGKKHGKKPS